MAVIRSLEIGCVPSNETFSVSAKLHICLLILNFVSCFRCNLGRPPVTSDVEQFLETIGGPFPTTRKSLEYFLDSNTERRAKSGRRGRNRRLAKPEEIPENLIADFDIGMNRFVGIAV